ncbi:hypothetical protein [Ferruginibacter profundus]
MKQKISFLTAIGLLAITLNATAQKDSSGIYQTADDFRNHKLSYAINYKTAKHKINDYLLFNSKQVKVKHHGITYTLDKSATYGYKSTTGEVFRFVGNETYQILNPDEDILLYLHTNPVDPRVYPAKKVEEHYYFSKAADSLVVDLTIGNLKKGFSENSKFLAFIDKYFEKDEQLTSYDTKNKMYTLNRLLKLSKQ